MSLPVIYFDEKGASDAFAVLRALEEREREQPELASNEFWQWVRQRARDTFANSFSEGHGG